MLLLSKQDIEKVFTIKDAIASNKIAYQLFSKNECEVPLRTNIEAAVPSSCFLFMPAYSAKEEAAAVKIVNVFPENQQKGMPVISSQVLLIDGLTGAILAILDGECVTAMRTGASSGLAFELFAKNKCEVGAMIGTGGQAEKQLEAMLCARKLKQVNISARDFEKTKKFVQDMQAKFKNVEIKAFESANEAIKDADLIITVTTSNQPVFDAKYVKKGATISCVGSYTPDMQELDPKIFTYNPKIYFDSKEAVLAESGDFITPLNQGIIEEKHFTGDIGDVLSGKISARENEEEIIVFKTVGLGVQDLTSAQKIYQLASKHNIGLNWGK